MGEEEEVGKGDISIRATQIGTVSAGTHTGRHKVDWCTKHVHRSSIRHEESGACGIRWRGNMRF